MSNEIERIRKAYTERDRLPAERSVWSCFNPAALFITQSRDREINKLLGKFGLDAISDWKILDVGCGTGGELIKFLIRGVPPPNLYGIDLMEHRIEKAKMLCPVINFTVGNAEHLPYPDNFFDLVIQFTCFSSILDLEVKKNVAREMLRVLKKGGLILWYDIRPISWLFEYCFRVTSKVGKGMLNLFPGKETVRTKDRPRAATPTQPLSLPEIRELFPGCHLAGGGSQTLYFPLTSLLARSYFLCQLFSSIPGIRSHYLILLRKGMERSPELF